MALNQVCAHDFLSDVWDCPWSLSVHLTQPTWVAAASLQHMLATDKTSACTCHNDVHKRLAHASAVARQHIALGLTPQHTRVLRVLPTCAAQPKVGSLCTPRTCNCTDVYKLCLLVWQCCLSHDPFYVASRHQMLLQKSKLSTWLSYCRSKLVRSLLNRCDYIYTCFHVMGLSLLSFKKSRGFRCHQTPGKLLMAHHSGP